MVSVQFRHNIVKEYDARECELDCCEQQFFGTFKTSVNQQTGEFPKKSQPSVPDKKKDDSSTPDKPSVDTPTKPSENGSTDNGNVNPNSPSDNNGNAGTNPSAPSENNGSTESGNNTPSNPSKNGGSAGNTDSGNVNPSNPSENNGGTVARRTENLIVLQDYDDNYSTLLDFTVQGVVGDTVSLGDFIKKQLNSNPEQEQGKLNADGNFEKNGIVYTSEKITPNLRDYLYTIKESNDDENSFTYEYIPLKRTATDTSSDRG